MPHSRLELQKLAGQKLIGFLIIALTIMIRIIAIIISDDGWWCLSPASTSPSSSSRLFCWDEWAEIRGLPRSDHPGAPSGRKSSGHHQHHHIVMIIIIVINDACRGKELLGHVSSGQRFLSAKVVRNPLRKSVVLVRIWSTLYLLAKLSQKLPSPIPPPVSGRVLGQHYWPKSKWPYSH